MAFLHFNQPKNTYFPSSSCLAATSHLVPSSFYHHLSHSCFLSLSPLIFCFILVGGGGGGGGGAEGVDSQQSNFIICLT
jgi:hypothetical protein